MKDGTCEVGSNPVRTAKPDGNLAFDGVTPLTRVQFLGKPLELVLDTGNQSGTQLWELFARDFPEVMSEGTKSTKQVQQIGRLCGTTHCRDPRNSPSRKRIQQHASARQCILETHGNDLQHGNLGLDALSQAAEVMIDSKRCH